MNNFIPDDSLNGLEETLEIISDPEAMAQIQKGIQEIEEGKGIPWETVKAQLSLIGEIEQLDK